METKHGEVDHRPVETRYFAKKPGKEYRQSMKNVDWAKFREDIGEKMKGWEIPRTMTRNQLDEEVDKWHSILSEVVGKHSKTVLVRPKDPIVNQWYTEELRQERKGIRDLCRKAEASLQGREEGVHEERPESGEGLLPRVCY